MKTAPWSYEAFKREFCARTGLDLECYKDGQMERRIRQFMSRSGSAGFSEFLELLQRDHEVMKQFQGYLTINTSSFFRDDAVFRFIETEIIPDLFGRNRRIKAWSAPCSTGEEPYSLAIILDRQGFLARTQLVASDIDSRALAHARRGEYGQHAVGNLPRQVLESYFTASGENFLVRDRIRQAVTFKTCDLLKEVERDNHLVLCRNFLIYLKRRAQEQTISRLVTNLKTGGFLVVGSAENIGNYRQWGLERLHHSVYRLKP